MKKLFLIILKGYKMVVSPMFPTSCRYTPTCSEYMYEAINDYGILNGLLFGVKRLLRCHPWHKGGYDPVPKKNMTNPTLWNQILIWPITNLLVLFYKLAESLHFPGPLGFAIISMTILFRIILYPLMSAQMKSARKMAKLKPHMDELQKKHKDDKQALQQAQMALYKEHGINPAAGCLPLLVQMPVLIALYNVFYSVFKNGDIQAMVSDINHIVYNPQLKLTTIDLNFFGFNLATKPSQWQTAGWWLLAIPIVTGLLQWYQTKLMMANQNAVKQQPEQLKIEKKKEKTGKKEEKPEQSQEDMAAEMQKQMSIISPLMFSFFAYQFPIGLALYWNLFGIFGIIQQRYINKKY